MDSQFEWAAHEPEALKGGVPAEIIDIIKRRKSTEDLSETEAAVIEFGDSYFAITKSPPKPSRGCGHCSNRASWSTSFC
jgi:4-carboxymuconolactone decarboxylase